MTTIEVFFDFICPWCYIGKRHLDAALAGVTHPVNVIWRSFPLLPHIPRHGVPFRQFYEGRLGSLQAIAARQSRVQEAGYTVSLQFDFEAIEVLPSTLAAHALLEKVSKDHPADTVAALIERIFSGYFCQAENISDPSVLARAGADCGIDTDGALCKPTIDQVRQWQAAVSRYSLASVPTMVLDGAQILPGLQTSKILLEHL